MRNIEHKIPHSELLANFSGMDKYKLTSIAHNLKYPNGSWTTIIENRFPRKIEWLKYLEEEDDYEFFIKEEADELLNYLNYKTQNFRDNRIVEISEDEQESDVLEIMAETLEETDISDPTIFLGDLNEFIKDYPFSYKLAGLLEPLK